MIPSISNKFNNNNKQFTYNNQRKNNQQTFKGAEFSIGTRFLDGFVKSQENLSVTRFVQDTTTNWLPKAVLSRSKADFWEFSLLEFIESGLFYFAAPLLGEHIYRKGLFKVVQPKEFKENIYNNLHKSVDEIKHSKVDKVLKNRLIATKGGIVLACLTVPALEYALSFAKNLFTLKVFKVSDFNNIANLNKNKKENYAQQKNVESHAKKELVKSGILSALGLGSGLVLASRGYNSKTAQKFSEILLEPGKHISKILAKFDFKSKKLDKFLNEYLKLDFNNRNGKLALSKGQLAVTCITGLFGYSNAAKDRGILDFYEVWTRVPIVVLYTIFGSSFLDGAFKKILAKNGKFPELIKKDKSGQIQDVPQRKDLPEIAKKLSKLNNTSYDSELGKLIRQKSVITGVPYVFSLVAVGFTLTAITRLWTRYRYKHQVQNQQSQNNSAEKDFLKISPAFEGFKTVAR